MQRVFVYGSLRRGMENHDVLYGAEFVGPARTGAQFQMFDLGRFPAVLPGDAVIEGEVYLTCDTVLERLDAFERVPELYVRRETVLDVGGAAWIYVYSAAANDVRFRERFPIVPQGDWAAWRQR